MQPSFAGHTCFETSADLLDAASLDEVNAQPLEGVEREEVLGRARRIIEVNDILVREDRFR